MTIVVVLNLSNCELRPTRTKTVTGIKTGNDLDTRRKRRGGGGETKDYLEMYSS